VDQLQNLADSMCSVWVLIYKRTAKNNGAKTASLHRLKRAGGRKLRAQRKVCRPDCGLNSEGLAVQNRSSSGLVKRGKIAWKLILYDLQPGKTKDQSIRL